MTITADFDAETTGAGPKDDPLTDALRSLQVTGSLLLCEDYRPPWGIDVPRADELARILGAPDDVRVVAFHLVRRGHFELQLGSEARRLVDAGELVLCTGGQRHRLSQGPVRTAVPLTQVLARRRPDARATAHAGAPTALVCGVFFLRDVKLNPLFQALPPALQIAATGAGADYLTRGVTELLLAELAEPQRGARYAVGRLLELLCAQAVGGYAQRVADQRASWFRGVRDPAIGAALSAIHARPGEPWSVTSLAERAALSSSRFAARFRELIGESPMAYVTRWRMSVARRLVRDGARSITEVAAAVGYDSVPAFSRVFKKLWGAPPSTFRAPV